MLITEYPPNLPAYPPADADLAMLERMAMIRIARFTSLAKATSEEMYYIGTILKKAHSLLGPKDYNDWCRFKLGLSRTTSWRYRTLAEKYKSLEEVQGYTAKELLEGEEEAEAEEGATEVKTLPPVPVQRPAAPVSKKTIPVKGNVQSSISFSPDPPPLPPPPPEDAEYEELFDEEEVEEDDDDPFNPSPPKTETLMEKAVREKAEAKRSLADANRAIAQLQEQVKVLEDAARPEAMERMAALRNAQEREKTLVAACFQLFEETAALWAALRSSNGGRVSHQTLAEKYLINEWSATVEAKNLRRDISR